MEIIRVVAPETVKMKLFERLISLFASPGKLMANLKQYPVAWATLAICMAISLASLPLTLRFADIQTRELSIASIDRYGVDYFNLVVYDFDDDEFVQTVTATVTRVTAGITALITYPLAAFFSTLGLFILAKIARGPGKFQQYFAMYAHLCLITALGAAITAYACVTFDNTLDVTSLAAVFMPNGNYASLTYNMLSSITLPLVWVTVLSIIGLKVFNEWSMNKAITVGSVAFVLIVGFRAAILGATFFAIDWLDGFLVGGIL
jgi:hypothetical protein